MTVEFGHMKYRVLVFARNCNVVRRKKFVIILPKRAENPKLNPNPILMVALFLCLITLCYIMATTNVYYTPLATGTSNFTRRGLYCTLRVCQQM